MCTPIRYFELTNTIFNNHNNSVCIGNMYTVSTDNPGITFILLTYALVLCWGNISNSNATMKFAQLHYFSSQNVGGDKIYYAPLSKSWGRHVPPVPPINSVPAGASTCLPQLHVILLSVRVYFHATLLKKNIGLFC